MMSSQQLFGILNVSKQPGITSRDVVNAVQKLVRPAKCGHAGTLDPMATGVLLVCVGQATRLVSLLQEASKAYVAEFVLGQRSDTDDSTGNIETMPVPDQIPDRELIVQSLQAMTGTIQQVPPAYSAIHVNGRRAYDLARRGEEVLLTARSVRIDAIRLLEYEWPKLTLRIDCGSGTYIRSIARDLGNQLGCGGLMSSLQRIRIGSFCVSDAISSENLTKESVCRYIQSPVAAVGRLRTYRCDAADTARLVCGKQITPDMARMMLPTDDSSPAESTSPDCRHLMNSVALLSEDASQLLALAEWSSCGAMLQPRTVFLQRN